jgi:hypothetical protein
VYVSTDLGETWVRVVELAATVADGAWIDRDGTASLLLATGAGLYEVEAQPNAVPLQVLVDPNNPGAPFSAVRSFVSERGVTAVAVAGIGVHLSVSGGRSNTFTLAGLAGIDLRSLAVQYDGPVTVLWAGAAEPDPTRPGRGCFRARMFEANVLWEGLATGWLGGTCWGLALAGNTALAATQSGGVVRLDTSAQTPTWQPADINCGLPLRDRTRFVAVDTVAVGPSGLALIGGNSGVYRTGDLLAWTQTSNRTATDGVTVPDTWLLCSGDHDIEVVRADAA